MQTNINTRPPGGNTSPGEHTRRLDIRVSAASSRPTEDHHLLLGFQFGGDTDEHAHGAIIRLGLKPLNHDRLSESWWYRGEVTYTRSGSVRLAECDEYTVAIFETSDDGSRDFRSQSRDAYRELIGAVRSTKHTRLVKIWNYFDDINEGEGDSEKYRQFSIGRAEAFQDMGICDEESPTGTAIGTHNGNALVLVAIASNHHYCPVENPRQTSAFSYPRIYGPRSPKFSRGGFVSSDSHQLFLISGTASVVGHESNFPYDTPLQTNETIRNLEHLCEAISEMEKVEMQFTLDKQSVLRVYLKEPKDYQEVSQKINQQFRNNDQNIAYLHGTICRRELTVEIDGVKVVGGSENPASL